MLGRYDHLFKHKGTIVVHNALSKVDIGVNRLSIRVVQFSPQHGHVAVSLDVEFNVLGCPGEVLAVPLEGTYVSRFRAALCPWDVGESD